MESLIKKIIQLFGENETEVAYRDLRERARTQKMSLDDWMRGFSYLMKTGILGYNIEGGIVTLHPCNCAMECFEANNCRHLPKYFAA